jgi:hypothetical protein
LFARFNTRMSTSPIYRSTTDFARKHSRLSMVAAGAAAAGMITAGVAAAGAAPWSQALGAAATTANAGASGHSAGAAFDAANVFKLAAPNLAALGHSGATTDGHGPADQLMALHSAGTGGSTSPAASADTPAAFLGHAAVGSHPTAHQPVKVTTVAVTKPAAVKPVVAAKPVVKPLVKPQPAVPAQPYLFYDSVTPSSLPAGAPAAVYANGSYAASPSQVNGHRSVFWIDTDGSDTHAGVLDVEPGDATPAGAAQWVDAKLSASPTDIAVIYTMLSDWGQVKADIAGLPSSMQSHVQYWIADPTGYPHLVPGSTATQWYWGSNTDESTALGNFLR